MSFIDKILSFFGIKPNPAPETDLLQKIREQRANAFPKVSDWVIDPFHSSIKFRVMHMGIAEVVGSFREFEIGFKGTSPNFLDMKVNANIPVASIQTDMPARDGHLKSPDFFDVEQFPKVHFESTNITWKPLRSFSIQGNLTIKNKTKPVVFEGKIINFQPKDMMGFPRIGFELATEINRMDYGLAWQLELESKDKVVEETVKIEIRSEICTAEGMEALRNYLKLS